MDIKRKIIPSLAMVVTGSLLLKAVSAQEQAATMQSVGRPAVDVPNSLFAGFAFIVALAGVVWLVIEIWRLKP